MNSTCCVLSTHAIRSGRSNLLSLPDEHDYTRPLQHFRPTSPSTNELQKRRFSSGTDPTDRSHTQRAYSDVFTLLRKLEESARLALSKNAYDAVPGRASHRRPSCRI
ncbi:hypothetical protein EDB85DRAFT_2148565 [Lactarius pseudohatsudake]|nr:hypothetical protein EDB85DRAFT_2148565 [Lactarius pseudohatsudake]